MMDYMESIREEWACGVEWEPAHKCFYDPETGRWYDPDYDELDEDGHPVDDFDWDNNPYPVVYR